MARVAPGMIAPAMTTIQLQVPPDAHPGFMIQAKSKFLAVQPDARLASLAAT